jgi:WXG100 family type VII secretion target
VVTYAVNISNCQEVAGEMGAISAMINEMVDELNNQQTINLADWTSRAKDAYFRDQGVWNGAAANMAQQAGIAQASLSSITDAYANAEYQGLGLWGN